MQPSPNPSRQILAAVIGNALEWYDFIVYGFFSTIIARLFFPAQNDYVSLMAALATFGIGFFMRPVGGIVLGLYADRHGRKAAMQIVIAIMTLAIAMIAFAPTYASIGIAAPILMMVARMLQGFATGGEYSSSTAYLMESAPADKRGYYGSWQLVGQCLAVFCGAGIGALLTKNLAPAALDSWGWRVPFVLGLLIGPVGLWIRRHMHETDEFLNEAKLAGTQKVRLMDVVRTHLRGILISMGLVISGTVAFYVVLVTMPGFASKQLGIPLQQAFTVQMIAVALLTVIIPLAGKLSDRIGRRTVLLYSSVAFLVVVYPLFAWVTAAPSLSRLLIMQIILCVLIGANFGPMPTALSEQFATRVRSTGMSVAYNLAAMLFGGFAPMIVTWLTKVSGSPIAAAWYVLFATVLGVIAAWAMRDPAKETSVYGLTASGGIGELK